MRRTRGKEPECNNIKSSFLDIRVFAAAAQGVDGWDSFHPTLFTCFIHPRLPSPIDNPESGVSTMSAEVAQGTDLFLVLLLYQDLPNVLSK